MNRKAKPGQGERAAYKAKWYRANKKRILAHQRRYCQEHREEVAAYERRYRQEHREEIREYHRKRMGFKPWRKGGRGRPPLPKKEVSRNGG